MTVPSVMAKETTKMKITKNYLRRLIKEAIGGEMGEESGPRAYFTIRNKLKAGDRERNRNDYTDEDFEIVQAALSKAQPGANLIRVMGPGGTPTPEFMEKVHGQMAGEKDYIDFGKGDDGTLYFKRVNAESPMDETGYGYVSVEEQFPFRPKIGQFGKP